MKPDGLHGVVAMGVVLLLLPLVVVAEQAYQYGGMDISYAKVQGESASSSLMFLVGVGVRQTDHVSVALEVAVGGAEGYEGPVVKGGALLELASPRLGRTSAFVFGGPSIAILAEDRCYTYLLNSGPTYDVYQQECGMAYRRSVGGSAGVGLRVRGNDSGSLVLRYGYYRGVNFMTMHSLSLSIGY